MAVVLLIMALIVCVSFTSYWTRVPCRLQELRPNSLIPEPTLTMEVDGAVAYPVKVFLVKGEPLAKLMDQLPLTADADLSSFELQRKVWKGRKLWIPSTQYVFVELEGDGCVSGRLKVEKGTRLCDLLGQDRILPGADLKGLVGKRRRLKDGDRVVIPGGRDFFVARK